MYTKFKIETALFATALFNQLIHQQVETDSLALKNLFVGGEKMSLKHAELFVKKYKNTN